MFIEPILLTQNNSLDRLKSLIEEKIFKMAGFELDSVRFGIASKTNYDLLEDLEDYLEILEYKFYGCNCLEGFPMDVIGSRIRKLVNTTC